MHNKIALSCYIVLGKRFVYAKKQMLACKDDFF